MRLAPLDPAHTARALDAEYDRGHTGLEHHAFRRWRASQALTPWGRTHIEPIGLFHAEDLVASATRYTLTGQLEGRAVRIWAIGRLQTLSGNGDRGTMDALLAHVLDAAAANADVDLILVCDTPCAAWCTARGFQPLVAATVELTVSPTRHPGAPMTLVRGGEARDLQAIAAMGRTRALPFAFALERDEEFISHAVIVQRVLAGLGPSGNRELQFFIAEEGITAAAYIVMTVLGDAWTIEECGDRDPTGARVGALLQALVAREPSRRPPSIRGWLPHGFCPPQVTATTGPLESRVLMKVMNGPTPTLGAEQALYWRADLF